MNKKNRALSPEKQIMRLKKLVAQKELVILRLIKKGKKLASIAQKKEKIRKELFKKNKQEVKEAASLTESIIETNYSGFLVIDRKGKVLKTNRRFAQLWRVPKKVLATGDDKKLLKFIQTQLSEPTLFMEKVRELYRNPSERSHDFVSFKNGRTFERLSSPMYISGKPVARVWTFRDITANKELEQAKIEFIILASHQLRTPLAGTKWVLETLTEDKNLTQKQKEKIDELAASNERLIHIVNRMLDVTRVDTGKLAVTKKPTNIKELINEVVDILKISSENHKKTIKIGIPAQIKNIYCDPLLVKEALKNLLDNAINYSEPDSPNIDISVEEKKDDHQISVHSGGAIDPQTVNKINKAEKFIHGNSSSSYGSAGSGLGLYITRKLVEANGGTFWLESRVKSGTTFYFTIVKK